MNPIALHPEIDPLLRRGGLTPLKLGGRSLLPIVQGGMGVGVSAHRLAGSVAALGGVGTISSVDLRRHHPDLMARTRGLDLSAAAQARATIDAANLEALEREIAAARSRAQGRGLLAIYVMRAVSAYDPSVTRALEQGIDMVVVGAGLPLDLPDLAQDHPRALLVPILSDARGVQLIVRKWERKKRLPDAIVIEHPRLAGGHLGAARIAELDDARFEFDTVLPAVQRFLREAGVEKDIPMIAAGGVRSFDDIRRLQSLGAAGVQLGTPFAVTLEGDADEAFKRVLAQARDADLVEFISVAGLPARAVATPWLTRYLKALPRLQSTVHARRRCTKAFDCLAQCGLRDGLAGWGQFCIDHQLAAALDGDVAKGLFFRGRGALPFGEQIRPVRDLIEHLLAPPAVPAAVARVDDCGSSSVCAAAKPSRPRPARIPANDDHPVPQRRASCRPHARALVGVSCVVVAHRMLPFFSATALPWLHAWRPNWVLRPFVAAPSGEAAAAVSAPPPLAQAVVESAAAPLRPVMALRWGVLPCPRLHLLAVLHLGLVWFGVALALGAASRLLVASGPASLGLAPLHAFTMGFLGRSLVQGRAVQGHFLALENAWGMGGGCWPSRRCRASSRERASTGRQQGGLGPGGSPTLGNKVAICHTSSRPARAILSSC